MINFQALECFPLNFRVAPLFVNFLFTTYAACSRLLWTSLIIITFSIIFILSFSICYSIIFLWLVSFITAIHTCSTSSQRFLTRFPLACYISIKFSFILQWVIIFLSGEWILMSLQGFEFLHAFQMITPPIGLCSSLLACFTHYFRKVSYFLRIISLFFSFSSQSH